MTIRVIDTSGSMTYAQFAAARAEVQVGDHVILVDHQVRDHGIMQSQEQIDSLGLTGGGSSSFVSVLSYATKLGKGDELIACYTDGFHY